MEMGLPQQLLRPGPWPEDFVAALRQATLRANPDRRLTRMTPHRLDFGWGAKLAQFAEGPNFTTIAVWTAIGILLGLIGLFVL
jgi:hypothetical protein